MGVVDISNGKTNVISSYFVDISKKILQYAQYLNNLHGYFEKENELIFKHLNYET